MNVVVTGATGFIGSAIAAELLARGHRVVLLTRSTSDLSRLRACAGWVNFAADSWRDASFRERLREYSPHAFVHCAWQGVGGGDRNSACQITENLRLTADALELANESGCTHWISLGSQAEYGNPNRPISEDCPTQPTTLYGKAKLIAGDAARYFCETQGMLASVLRVFSTYGPGDAPNWFIPYIIRQFRSGHAPKLTACEQKWDYLYVTDAARAVASVVEQRVGGVFNLGSGQARPLRDVVELIRAELGTGLVPEYGAVPYRPDQVMWLQADISRLAQATGWKPVVEINTGLRFTIADSRASGC